MSFINLMAHDVWSDADILNRTESMIASEFPPEVADVLNRKVTAATLGQYVLSDTDQAELARYTAVAYAARAANAAAHADMALLREVMAIERGEAALADASPEAAALFALRNPPEQENPA